MQMLSLQMYWTCTVWNFLDFSVTQILREINFGKSKSSKTADFAILGALNFVHVVNFCLKKCKHSIFRCLICQLWFHVKSEWQKNLVISTLWLGNQNVIHVFVEEMWHMYRVSNLKRTFETPNLDKFKVLICKVLTNRFRIHNFLQPVNDVPSWSQNSWSFR